MTNKKSKSRDIARISLMVAVIEASKLALANLPNIELTSFLIIMFTLYFGRKILLAIPVFIVIEIIIFGFEPMWVIAYIYVWPLLYFLAKFLSKSKTSLSFALLSGFFGLFFGFLCSFPYLFITTGTNPNASLASAVAWWIAGIPFDIIHGISNFVIMLVLYKPVSKVLETINQNK